MTIVRHLSIGRSARHSGLAGDCAAGRGRTNPDATAAELRSQNRAPGNRSSRPPSRNPRPSRSHCLSLRCRRPGRRIDGSMWVTMKSILAAKCLHEHGKPLAEMHGARRRGRAADRIGATLRAARRHHTAAAARQSVTSTASPAPSGITTRNGTRPSIIVNSIPTRPHMLQPSVHSSSHHHHHHL